MGQPTRVSLPWQPQVPTTVTPHGRTVLVLMPVLLCGRCAQLAHMPRASNPSKPHATPTTRRLATRSFVPLPAEAPAAVLPHRAPTLPHCPAPLRRRHPPPPRPMATLLSHTLPTLLLLLLLLVTDVRASGAGGGGERGALLKFKGAVTADPGGLLRDWSPSSADHCLWPGVSCGASGEVVALNVSSSQIGRAHV